MADEKSVLRVFPAGLRAASDAIAGDAAQVSAPPAPRTVSVEGCGVAAASCDGVFSGFRAAFSQRLSAASSALTRAADSFTVMEDGNTAAVKSVVPERTA
jgi:hypothetical protein